MNRFPAGGWPRVVLVMTPGPGVVVLLIDPADPAALSQHSMPPPRAAKG